MRDGEAQRGEPFPSAAALDASSCPRTLDGLA